MKRFKTRVVIVGDVSIGGDNPIRMQSMTTTDTMDTLATVEQSIRIIEAGADLVRITAPSLNDAKNLENIKNELNARGYKTPLVADIHFTPNAAEVAARIVEKVRVNPGNYVDKKKFELLEYTDAEYQEELERLRQRFTPLVLICKEYGTAMRIGTNHGSLSDRIMSRYGDTPLGMVESAFEFIRICRDNNYHELVLSMKSSNPQVMVQAYRLLVSKMTDLGWDYPLHLGVTEAGDGEDGRIKSAIGIGTLLEEGIGDTIRVSLTEEPEFEVPVCIDLVKRYKNFNEAASPDKNQNEVVKSDAAVTVVNPFEYSRRETIEVGNIGNHHVPVVMIDASSKNIESHRDLVLLGYRYNELLDKWNIGDQAADYIYLGKNDLNFQIPGTLKKVFDFQPHPQPLSGGEGLKKVHSDFGWMMTLDQYLEEKYLEQIHFVKVEVHQLNNELISKLKTDSNAVILLSSSDSHPMHSIRNAFIKLIENKIKTPVIINLLTNNLNDDEFTLYNATDAGALLIDGLGDGIYLEDADKSFELINRCSFGILQATRTRISKTEYISCPSCGRTLFDLQETTAKIKARTYHLKGLKIAVMGCIVNGPGEMADADFGYVGSGIGKITLYKGKEVVKRNVPSSIAVDELISLIKENGMWVEVSEQLAVSS